MEFPSNSDRVLIFSPHPDDDVLAAGGLLQHIVIKQSAVRIVFLTDGDNNPWPQRVVEHRWHINESDRRRWGLKRRQEALAGLGQLGIGIEHAVFLGLPDQGLTSLLLKQDEGTVKKIAAEITCWNPNVIIAPAAFDLHPDHSAFAVLLKLAMRSAGVGGQPPIRLLHYSIHSDLPHPGKRLSVSLSSQQIAVKKAALMKHDSQMRLSRKRFLNYVRDQEYFYLEPVHESESIFHPVRMAFLEDGYLNLVLNKPGMIDRLIRPILHIVTNADPSICISVRMGFFNHGEVEIFGAIGSKSIAIGHIYSIRHSVAIRIPIAPIGNADEVFVKLDNKFVFFDRSGWKNLPVSETRSEDELPLPYAKTIALIPCFNVAGLCGDVISKTMKVADQVVVIDDGSTDGTGSVVADMMAQAKGNLHVIKKSVNEGKGSALLDGMRYALENYRFSALITIDGDGQHRPEDIPKAVQVITQNKDFVIGQRNFSRMPLRSRFGNTITGGLFRKLYPDCPSDTQSGFRAFSSRFVREIVAFINRGRYETELYILLLALTLGVDVDVFQIDTIYIDENSSSHFRPVIDSMRIMFSLLRWQLGALL